MSVQDNLCLYDWDLAVGNVSCKQPRDYKCSRFRIRKINFPRVQGLNGCKDACIASQAEVEGRAMPWGPLFS